MDDLTALRQAEAASAETSYTHLFSLLEREKKDHEEAEIRIDADNARLLSELDGLRRKLSALQTSSGSSAAGKRAEGSPDFVNHTGRCAELAARCAVELRRKEQALKTCVRAYEDVQIVSAPIN